MAFPDPTSSRYTQTSATVEKTNIISCVNSAILHHGLAAVLANEARVYPANDPTIATELASRLPDPKLAIVQPSGQLGLVRSLASLTQVIVITDDIRQQQITRWLLEGASLIIHPSIPLEDLRTAVRFCLGPGKVTGDVQHEVLKYMLSNYLASVRLGLTPDEYTVVSYISLGWRDKEVSEKSGLPYGTVRNLVSSTLAKLQQAGFPVYNRLQLTIWAHYTGIGKETDVLPAKVSSSGRNKKTKT